MSTENLQDKFKDMDYETALSELNRCIRILEKGEGDFLELIEVYKEAYEYYTYCTAYLNTAADKIKDLNLRMAQVQKFMEVGTDE